MKFRLSYLLPWNWFKCCCAGAGAEPRSEDEDPCWKLLEKHPQIKQPNRKVKHGKNPRDPESMARNYDSFHLYLREGDHYLYEDTVSLVCFSTFGTYKDMLSKVFGQQNQNDYDILFGTEEHKWISVERVQGYRPNRIYKVISRGKDQNEYIILTQFPFSKYVSKETEQNQYAKYRKVNFDTLKAYNA